ncbi:hypothetical protein N431DRAFT_463062 [Stipitochalara longipes BDJ]|nr:hypothetical protein N431DRAFT_463062 [Stipitochalara longipes BDJ]
MYFFNFQTACSAMLALLLHACITSANVNIYNWCPFDVYTTEIVFQTTNDPVLIRSGSDHIYPKEWSPSVNIKISKTPSLTNGILQFEYTANQTTNSFWFNLSMIDGTSPAVPGNIFAGYNLAVTPTGDLGGKGFDCVQISCPALPPPNTYGPCADAYWEPHDDAKSVKICPADVGDLYVDLCGFVRPFPVA